MAGTSVCSTTTINLRERAARRDAVQAFSQLTVSTSRSGGLRRLGDALAVGFVSPV
jgi:hypothetical protein